MSEHDGQSVIQPKLQEERRGAVHKVAVASQPFLLRCEERREQTGPMAAVSEPHSHAPARRPSATTADARTGRALGESESGAKTTLLSWYYGEVSELRLRDSRDSRGKRPPKADNTEELKAELA